MPPSSDKPLKILIIEDNETNATLFAAMLERLGYDSHICPTGGDALG